MAISQKVRDLIKSAWDDGSPCLVATQGPNGPNISPKGSMLVFEAKDETEARAFNAADPSVKSGLFEHVETRAWKMTVNEIGVVL